MAVLMLPGDGDHAQPLFWAIAKAELRVAHCGCRHNPGGLGME